MSEPRTPNGRDTETVFSREVGAQATRKMKARRGDQRSTWFGLGLSGLIGWSVSTPTLIGTAVGIWIDKTYPGPYSWTLMLLVIGLIIGCLNAWHWVKSEYKEMQDGSDE